MLATAFRVLVRCWPALLAWFLLGWTIRSLILRGAGYLLNIDENVALLFLPLAILAQLAAFIGMFFAIRRELPNVSQVGVVEGRATLASTTRQWSETLIAAILPFFLLYVAWNVVRDDVVDLYAAAITHDNVGANDNIGEATMATVAILVIAFAVRWLLGRFSERLPRWVSIVATYFEAVWVFVALTLIRDALTWLGGWLATRRMFAGIVDAWAELRGDFSWLRVVGDGLGWVWAQVGTLVGLPLAWLAFAAIVYVGTIPRFSRPEAKAARTAAAARAATERWSRMPVWVRRIGSAVSSGFLERWRPVGLAARLIWRTGPIAVGTYLLAFAVIGAASEWLRMLVYRLLGPHETSWWFGASDAVELGIDALVAVLQIVLVAAAFDHALRSEVARPEDSGGPSETEARSAQPTTH